MSAARSLSCPIRAIRLQACGVGAGPSRRADRAAFRTENQARTLFSALSRSPFQAARAGPPADSLPASRGPVFCLVAAWWGPGKELVDMMPCDAIVRVYVNEFDSSVGQCLTLDSHWDDVIDPGEGASVGMAKDGRPLTHLEKLDDPESRVTWLTSICGELHDGKLWQAEQRPHMLVGVMLPRGRPDQLIAVGQFPQPGTVLRRDVDREPVDRVLGELFRIRRR